MEIFIDKKKKKKRKQKKKKPTVKLLLFLSIVHLSIHYLYSKQDELRENLHVAGIEAMWLEVKNKNKKKKKKTTKKKKKKQKAFILGYVSLLTFLLYRPPSSHQS